MPPDAPPSTVSGGPRSALEALRPVGAVRLLSAFAGEQSDPNRFYTLLAQDSIALVERHTSLTGVWPSTRGRSSCASSTRCHATPARRSPRDRCAICSEPVRTRVPARTGAS